MHQYVYIQTISFWNYFGVYLFNRGELSVRSPHPLISLLCEFISHLYLIKFFSQCEFCSIFGLCSATFPKTKLLFPRLCNYGLSVVGYTVFCYSSILSEAFESIFFTDQAVLF